MIYMLAAILLLPMMIYSIIVSSNVQKTFNKYSLIHSASRKSAARVAREVLDNAGLSNVEIQRTQGKLTDHYDPRNNTVFLSDSVYDSLSVAAIGVATHEVGHAIQHNTGYFPAKIRMAIVPMVNLGSKLSVPLFFIALLIQGFTGIGIIQDIVIYAAIALFGLTTLFTFITLPVEFNASNRAIKILESNEFLQSDEVAMSAAVLRAAAQTYVASFAMSVVQLMRFAGLLLRNRNNRN